MKSFKDMIIEALKVIVMKGKPLKWNPQKTDDDFITRIKQRTQMTVNEFYTVLQEGIKSGEKQFPERGVVCLNFLRSKFVAILDIDKHQITTIRDARWDKPSNKCNKKVIVTEDYSDMEDLVNNVFENATEFDGYHLNILTESEYMSETSGWLLEVEHHCDYCVDVDK